MDMLGVALVDVGLVCLFLGGICLCKPINSIRIRSRSTATILGLCGILAIVVGGNLPVYETRVTKNTTLLDKFTPVYQFHELHTTEVEASCDRVYAAVQTTEPDEILGFRTLTRIWHFGRRAGAPNILNPPAHQPILQTALRTGFVPLADDPGKEVVIGLVMSPLLMGWKPTSNQFQKLEGPLLVKATMNFRMDPIDGHHCRLSTETRMYGSDRDALHLFAMYWRVIYPGSAFIRRMWLRGIRLRAESREARSQRLQMLDPHASFAQFAAALIELSATLKTWTDKTRPCNHLCKAVSSVRSRLLEYGRCLSNGI